jgi:hypothetical protein
MNANRKSFSNDVQHKKVFISLMKFFSFQQAKPEGGTVKDWNQLTKYLCILT